MKVNSVTVFCGASQGKGNLYKEKAFGLGAALAERGITIVYGGGAVGLMGALADGSLSKGGTVKGVIPEFLVNREMAHPDVQHMSVVESMHERKALMEELGDAIITLPGGAGTLEEFFEMFTWGQIGLHRKPIGILDINQFFDPLVNLFENLIAEGFLQEEYLTHLFISEDIDEILKGFDDFEPVEIRSYDSKRHR
ncbi:TIGR00730 family Rossman fold protein [Salinicoccus siamensis]|uniref:Cytokinin riboside 5'-monophosphate phosphoribohydrolase n=1 Tax=Salinicoccus siamensis TaxID=381830 RepID=A0ABV5Z0A7_9STAP